MTLTSAKTLTLSFDDAVTAMDEGQGLINMDAVAAAIPAGREALTYLAALVATADEAAAWEAALRYRETLRDAEWAGLNIR